MRDPARNAEAQLATRAWAASGAMALTGWPDRRGLGPPAPLVPRLSAVAELLRDRSAALGRAVELDPLVLLTERAAAMGLARRGRTSCGGATRLLPAGDGWVAVSLARPEDEELVPAWLGLPGPADDPWVEVERAVARRPPAEVVAEGAALGLPVAVLPGSLPVHASDRAPGGLPVRAQRLGRVGPPRSVDGLVVVDLGSLWAGPLCGSLLADAGATVVKVESSARPDGARRGNREFFDLMNAGKRTVALDLGAPDGVQALHGLIRSADVVIEASRPRALEQLGIDARATVAADGGPRVWVSITAHGREGPGRERVGFGDDAAVSGGLVAWDGDEPCFCADAVADPAAGLVAATAVLDALAGGDRWIVDVSLAGVAGHLAGPTLPMPADVGASPPIRRPPRGAARDLGADTATVLTELGLRT